MSKKSSVGLGCWDEFFASRLRSGGVAQFDRMITGRAPVFNAVLEHKIANSPYAKQAQSSGCALDEEWKSNFMYKLLADSPKTSDVLIKILEHNDVLKQFGLDCTVECNLNDSVTIDMLCLRLRFLYMYCRFDMAIVFRIFAAYLDMFSGALRVQFAQILWARLPDVVDWYRADFGRKQEYCSLIQGMYQALINDTRQMYAKSEQQVKEKYEKIDKYKQLLQTKQISKCRG